MYSISKTNMILKMIPLHRNLLVRAAQISVRNISCSSALRTEKNLYETLGLTRDATQADIKNAYFQLSKLYHPDKIAATDENIAKFREVSAAYEILGNEQSRKMYDRGLLSGLKAPTIKQDEPEDPIVKFYKTRHEISRASSKQSEEVEAWAQTYFKDAKTKAFKKQELYHKAGKIDRQLDNIPSKWFDVLVLMVVMFLWLSNMEGTRAERLMNQLYGLFG